MVLFQALLCLLIAGTSFACESDLDCYQSPCVNGTCQCGKNPFYLPQEKDCSSGLAAIERFGHYGVWYTYVVFVSVTFGVGFLFIVGFFVRGFFKAGLPPRNVTTYSLGCLCLAFFLRSFYFSVDPHGLYLILPAVFGRFVFSIFYSIYFSAFSLLLLVWVNLCGHRLTGDEDFFKKIRLPFLVINIILYGFELTMVIWQAIHVDLDWLLLTTYSAYLALIIVSTAIAHIVYGRMFLRTVGRINPNDQQENMRRKILSRKVTLLSIGVSSLMLVGVAFQFVWLALGFVGIKNTLQAILQEFFLRVIEAATCYLTLYVLVMRTSSSNKSSEYNSKGPTTASVKMEQRMPRPMTDPGQSESDYAKGSLDADAIMEELKC